MSSHRWLGCALLGALAGCQGDSLPRVRYGEEACAHCRMIINDERFAAALAQSAGESLKFDDVGCLVAYLEAHPQAQGRRWIRSYQSAEWLDAEHASFVHGPQLQTPMASGVAAVGSDEAAAALAREWQGTTLRFADLARLLATTRKAHEASRAPAGTDPRFTHERIPDEDQ